MFFLAAGLDVADHVEEALVVYEACIETTRRYKDPTYVEAQFNVANVYAKLGRVEEALDSRRYTCKLLQASSNPVTKLTAAGNLATSLVQTKRYAECKDLCREQIAIAEQHGLGAHKAGINLKDTLASALLEENKFCAEDLREALAILEAIVPMSRRLLGGAHPYTKRMEVTLTAARVRGTFLFPKEG